MKRCLSILLSIALQFSAQAAYSLSSSMQVELATLPAPVQRWLKYETDYLSRDVNTTLIKSPAQNDQNPFYAPEEGNVFELTGYWIREESARVFSADIPPELRKLFFRVDKGVREVLFLVHPESADLYPDVIKNASGTEIFHAAATASSRSLLIWKPGEASAPFIAKLSLNKTVGHILRTIKGQEVARSVGTTKILSAAEDLPAAAVFMSEPLGMIPTGMERGGMIVRSLPSEMLNDDSTFVPLFALYGNDTHPGLLLDMINNSEMSPGEFVKTRIIDPFVDMWTKLAVEDGILMEAHAQNVLIEIKNGQPTGRFLFRDFGGFNVDLSYRTELGYSLPELPTFTGSVHDDYFQDEHEGQIVKSLRTYFEGGFLYNIERAIAKWQKQGLLSKGSKPLASGWTHSAMMKDLSQNLTRRTQYNLSFRQYFESPKSSKFFNAVGTARMMFKRLFLPCETALAPRG